MTDLEQAIADMVQQAVDMIYVGSLSWKMYLLSPQNYAAGFSSCPGGVYAAAGAYSLQRSVFWV